MSDDHEKRDDLVAERRRLLKQAMAGGIVGVALLPERWVRPVVDAVIVPAHAQTSPAQTTTTAAPGTTNTTTTSAPSTTILTTTTTVAPSTTILTTTTTVAPSTTILTTTTTVAPSTTVGP
jgi:hypothetical protein